MDKGLFVGHLGVFGFRGLGFRGLGFRGLRSRGVYIYIRVWKSM